MKLGNFDPSPTLYAETFKLFYWYPVYSSSFMFYEISKFPGFPPSGIHPGYGAPFRPDLSFLLGVAFLIMESFNWVAVGVDAFISAFPIQRKYIFGSVCSYISTCTICDCRQPGKKRMLSTDMLLIINLRVFIIIDQPVTL